MQGFFYTFPETDEFRTHDLYKPHPTLPHHWMHNGRADNVIVFSNGEKLNPVTTEGIVQGHPQVKGALVVGSKRFQPGLLIEPFSHPQNQEEENQLLDQVWPYVEKANAEAVAHGRISRDFIAVAEKSFLRTAKGTLQRPATLVHLADEIEELYARAETASSLHAEVLDLNPETLSESLLKFVATHVRTSGLDVDSNFFSFGMDSLQVMNLSRRLRASCEATGLANLAASLIPRAIYDNPTPRRLSEFMLSVIGGESSGIPQKENDDEREIQVMETLYRRYTENLIQSKGPRPSASGRGQIVLLTGSTGTLGSHLLDQLVRSDAVDKIICLNRALDGGAKQQSKSMKDRGLASHYAEKAEFHHMDVSEAKLGLPDEVYERLLEEADSIIHNGWAVNFNHTTETFEPHLRGVRSLCDLAAQATKRVAMLFVSSRGSVSRWDPRNGPVPEVRQEDKMLPSTGYGRSKMLASHILDDAGKAGGFPAASILVGQIAGPKSADGGSWNRAEWVPSLIASSVHLSALPGDLGRANLVYWMPVETAAAVVLEVAGLDDGRGEVDPASGFFNCVNPAVCTWQDLVPAMQEFYGDRIQHIVSPEEWIDRLRQSQVADNDGAGTTNPALKLIDSYRPMLLGDGSGDGEESAGSFVFDVTRTKGRSQTMRDMGPITPELMALWCQQWAY